MVGSAHAPSSVIAVPSPPPGWTIRSPTVVDAPPGSTFAVASEPQAGPVGVPSGSSAIASPVLAWTAISPGSPARPATTTASRPRNPSCAGREAADGGADGASEPVGAGAAGGDAGDDAVELHAAMTTATAV